LWIPEPGCLAGEDGIEEGAGLVSGFVKVGLDVDLCRQALVRLGPACGRRWKALGERLLRPFAERRVEGVAELGGIDVLGVCDEEDVDEVFSGGCSAVRFRRRCGCRRAPSRLWVLTVAPLSGRPRSDVDLDLVVRFTHLVGCEGVGRRPAQDCAGGHVELRSVALAHERCSREQS
jgi:hypothetical protein